MPRYRYVCEECGLEQIKFHLFSESPKYFCNDCDLQAGTPCPDDNTIGEPCGFSGGHKYCASIDECPIVDCNGQCGLGAVED